MIIRVLVSHTKYFSNLYISRKMGPFDHLRDFKVVVTFNPIGSAPRLKVNKFTINGTLTMGELKECLYQLLPASDIHLYVQQSIEMFDHQHVGDICRLFSPSGQTLSVHYSIGRAYL